jgi:hypothetical protein
MDFFVLHKIEYRGKPMLAKYYFNGSQAWLVMGWHGFPGFPRFALFSLVPWFTLKM